MSETQSSEQENNYLFVEVAAQRCTQLMRGAKPKVDVVAHKFTTIATEEVDRGLIPWQFVDEEELVAEGEDADED